MPARYRKGLFLLGILTSLWLLGTWLLTRYDLDRRVAALFYSSAQGWIGEHTQPWRFLYDYGEFSNVLLVLGLFLGLVATLFKPLWATWRPYLWLMLLTCLLGSALIVNGLLKDYWGRPRPRQIQEFGGRWEYRPIHQPGIAGQGKSFPCGHCTVGYVFVAAIYWIPRSRWLGWGGAAFGVVFGILMSAARLAQGGHFLGDAFWALGVILLLSTFLYYFVLYPPDYVPSPWKFPQRSALWRWGLGGSALLGLATVLFLMRRPVFEDHRHNLDLGPAVQQVKLVFNFESEAVTLRYLDEGELGYIETTVTGVGWPEVHHQVKIQRRLEGHLYQVSYDLEPQGYFAERNIRMKLTVPRRLEGQVFLEGALGAGD